MWAGLGGRSLGWSCLLARSMLEPCDEGIRCGRVSLPHIKRGTIPTREHGGVRAGFQNQELALLFPR